MGYNKAAALMGGSWRSAVVLVLINDLRQAISASDANPANLTKYLTFWKLIGHRIECWACIDIAMLSWLLPDCVQSFMKGLKLFKGQLHRSTTGTTPVLLNPIGCLEITNGGEAPSPRRVRFKGIATRSAVTQAFRLEPRNSSNGPAPW